MFIINLLLSFSLIGSIPVSASTLGNESFEPNSRLLNGSNYSYIYSYDYYQDVSLPKIKEIKEQEITKQKAAQKEIEEAEQKKRDEETKSRLEQESIYKRKKQTQLIRKAKEDTKPSPSSYQGTDYGTYIIQKCGQYGCNADQLIRVMFCESGGRSNARNGIYLGLFQFHPKTFNANAGRVGIGGADIWNPYHQIEVAAWMFSKGQAGQWSCK